MFEKGSEWRRWDLHVHTPETKKNDNYKGKTIEEKWENFYTAINEYVNESNESKKVTVIGITDYFSIENYKKILKDNRLPKDMVCFPNVEMRITPTGTASPVNIHFIFNPEIIDEIEARFFSKLKFQSGDREYGGSKEELILLGKSLGAKTDEEAYLKGIDSFILSYKDVYELFQKDQNLRENTLIGVSNKSTDGASGIDRGENGGQLVATKRAVYKLCDFIFSANAKDIKYFCGKGVDSVEAVIHNYGSLKPCFHGSDSHSLEKIFEPNDKKYCWIKADPTFNGLKQAIYEPEVRVRISETKPEEKYGYHVIEKVVIDDMDFSSDPIVFNDQLTCIIGGKSTGKSLLLQNIARAIDNKQVEDKLAVSQLNSKKIENVEVIWKDGEISKNGQPDMTHKIVYIPQTYLNRLTEGGEQTSEIDKIIQDIVMLNEECKNAYEIMEHKVKNYKPDLDKKIYDLLHIQEEINELINSRNEIGTEIGIEKEIDKLNQQKEFISKDAAITEEEVKTYDASIKKMAESEAIIKECDKDIASLKNLEMPFVKVDIKDSFSEELLIMIQEFQQLLMKEAEKKWVEKKGNLATRLIVRKNTAVKTLEKEREVIKVLFEKIKKNETFTKITEQIKKESQKYEEVVSYNKKIDTKKNEYEKLLDDVSKSVDNYKKIHYDYANMVNNNMKKDSDDSDGLDFSVKIKFKSEMFCSTVKECINNNFLKRENCNLNDEFSEKQYTKNFIKDLIDKVLRGDLKLLKNQNIENVVRVILGDWYLVTYDVKMENDTINQMSPGKKALVLLKLLISMADSRCPILIDQPEDDLDNRSIFDELIPFIREKKIVRQILIVTHNANVVLGGDAEEIIVANQDGNNSPNAKFRFEYRSGSIENDTPILNLNGEKQGVLNEKGIQQHICDVLEGGERAFDLRKRKYRI